MKGRRARSERRSIPIRRSYSKCSRCSERNEIEIVIDRLKCRSKYGVSSCNIPLRWVQKMRMQARGWDQAAAIMRILRRRHA